MYNLQTERLTERQTERLSDGLAFLPINWLTNYVVKGADGMTAWLTDKLTHSLIE